jgi:hypothetical protein
MLAGSSRYTFKAPVANPLGARAEPCFARPLHMISRSQLAVPRVVHRFAWCSDRRSLKGVDRAFEVKRPKRRYRGQSDEAMHWLERSYTQKEPFLFFVKTEIAPTMPADDPKFKAFLRKMNLPE